jgi:hypothetical protein
VIGKGLRSSRRVARRDLRPHLAFVGGRHRGDISNGNRDGWRVPLLNAARVLTGDLGEQRLRRRCP